MYMRIKYFRLRYLRSFGLGRDIKLVPGDPQLSEALCDFVYFRVLDWEAFLRRSS